MALATGDSEGVATDAAWGSDADADWPAFEGHVGFMGYHPQAAGWFFGGWITHPWPQGHRPQHVTADFAGASIDHHAHAVYYHREDVSGRGIGYVFFFPTDIATPGAFEALRIQSAVATYQIYATPDALLLDEAIGVESFAVLYPGPDLQGGGEGIACFVRDGGTPLGHLTAAAFSACHVRAQLSAAPTTARMRESELMVYNAWQHQRRSYEGVLLAVAVQRARLTRTL